MSGIVLQVVGLLMEHPNVVLDENYEGAEEPPTEEPPADAEVRLWGNLVGFLERLDDELFKSLQVRFCMLCPASPSAPWPCGDCVGFDVTACSISRASLQPRQIWHVQRVAGERLGVMSRLVGVDFLLACSPLSQSVLIGVDPGVVLGCRS